MNISNIPEYLTNLYEMFGAKTIARFEIFYVKYFVLIEIIIFDTFFGISLCVQMELKEIKTCNCVKFNILRYRQMEILHLT